MIETERLLLRPFRESDASDVYEYLKSPQVNCFACMKLNTPEEAKAAVLKKSRETQYLFAIVLKESDKVIGEIEALPETSTPDRETALPDTFSPCWMLNREYHGKGYAYEAAQAFLIICLPKKVQDEFTLTRKTITCRAKSYVKNSACAVKENSKNLFPL